MKFAVASEHRDFFRREQVIEFEGLLTEKQLLEANQAIDQALTLQITQNKPSAFQLFMAGRDLWRSRPPLKKLATHCQLAEIAAELVEDKPLRLGYDQYFPPYPSVAKQLFFMEDSYLALIKEPHSLNEISNLQGILCGVMICLKSSPEPNNKIDSAKTVFASKAGNAIFFHPDLIIDFNQMQNHSGQDYFLIVYTQSYAVYVINKQDPHAHALKTLGYAAGDRLIDKHHPIVCR
jgi:hypothetical protein